MALQTPEALATLLAPGERVVGVDVGTTTLGLAVSDPTLLLAAPIGTIARGKFAADMDALRRVLAERRVRTLIVGLPVNMDGSEGPRCESVRDWAREVLNRREALGVEPEIAFWDERLSTAAVERAMIAEGDLSRAKRARAVDAAAAAWILQGALDRLRALRAGAESG